MPQQETSNGEGNIQPIDRSRSFADVMDRIANELVPENILNRTVAELRQLLMCDRVLVYSLDGDSYGVVVAESVATGWSKALGKTIDDPCFAARYLEKYRQGRVRAWDNVYAEALTPCYREQLEALEVKAKIVAPIVNPIINEGQIFGLLIAHQCADTRNWREPEIHWLTEIATQTGMMLEHTKMSAETVQEEPKQLAEIESKWNQNFTEAIQYIRQSLNQEDILKASVNKVRKILDCDRVLIYSMNQDSYGIVVAESVAAAWTRAQGMVIKDPCFEANYLDQYRNGRVRAWSNIYEFGFQTCYIEQLEKLEVKANLVAPIIKEGKLFGLLVSHQCSGFREWQQPEIFWIAQIATQIGFALDNAKLLTDSVQLQHELANEAKLTQYFTDATRYIRESLKQEDILDVTVEEVRRVLECDRVVVYSLNHDNYGIVIAESVAPEWTRALGKQIDDPCFEATYRQNYLDGRVRAWSDIREGNISQCYIEQLEKLEVKANLVAPIINEGQLFGLLVNHQCSQTRAWQQSEIRWVTQIATQVGFALDNAKLLVKARQLQQQVEDEGKWADYFTNSVQHIRQSLTTEDILKTTVGEVRRILKCDRVVVYSLSQDSNAQVIAESVAPGWTRALGKKIDDPCFENNYRAKYRNGRVRACNNIREAGMSPCYIEQLEKLEVKANLISPIIQEEQLFGLLVAHQCSNTREWQQPEIRWLAQIAMQVGFALEKVTLFSQLDQSTKTSDWMSHQHEQTETLKHQLVEILANNGEAYQNISYEAMRQFETTNRVLHQIQEVADSFSNTALNAQQVKLQKQQNDLAVQITKETLEDAINSISTIHSTVQNVTVGFDNLSNSCHKLTEIVNRIKDLNKQIVQQSLSITRAVNLSQIEDGNQNSLIEFSDSIFSLMPELLEATVKFELLFTNIQTEVREKTITLESGTEKLMNGVSQLPTVRQKLEQVVTLNHQTSSLMANISQSLENQIENSTFVKDATQEIAGIAERISEQSLAITQSFEQLVLLIQKLQD